MSHKFTCDHLHTCYIQHRNNRTHKNFHYKTVNVVLKCEINCCHKIKIGILIEWITVKIRYPRAFTDAVATVKKTKVRYNDTNNDVNFTIVYYVAHKKWGGEKKAKMLDLVLHLAFYQFDDSPRMRQFNGFDFANFIAQIL